LGICADDFIEFGILHQFCYEAREEWDVRSRDRIEPNQVPDVHECVCDPGFYDADLPCGALR
jgi:hypothetical protein